MQQTILSATVTLREDTPALSLRPSSGINILTGNKAENLFWILAGLFNITKGVPLSLGGTVQANIQWQNQRIYRVTGLESDGLLGVFVNWVTSSGHIARNTDSLVKQFHKQRLLNILDAPCFFDGALAVSQQCFGESDLLLEQFDVFLRDAAAARSERPLFICNFLERLDEAIDRSAIFDALKDTGRQVFLLLPHCHPLAACACDTTVHQL